MIPHRVGAWNSSGSFSRGPISIESSMLTNAPIPSQLQSSHITGSDNHNADLLPRPSLAPTCASTCASDIEQSQPSLDPRSAYQVPQRLFSTIAKVAFDNFTHLQDDASHRQLALYIHGLSENYIRTDQYDREYVQDGDCKAKKYCYCDGNCARTVPKYFDK